MDTKELGNFGENLACEYLVKNGYEILERNCVLFCGEIDVVAKKKSKLFGSKDKTMHFVEVKTSQSFHPEQSEGFSPEQRVGYKKQNKYKRLVEIWLEKNKFPQNYPCQVDIIAVSVDGDKPEIKYFENVISS
jgi:putative endonuclease